MTAADQNHTEPHTGDPDDSIARFISEAPVAVAMFDKEMRHIAWSHLWSETYGVADGALKGKTLPEVYPALPDRCHDAHTRALVGETVAGQEERIELPDGRVTWVRWQIKPVENRLGDISGTVVFSEDITARKIAQTQLRASEERLRLMMKSTGIGTLEVDCTTGKILVSEIFLDLLGQEASNAPTTLDGWIEVLNPPDALTFRKAWDSAFDPSGDGLISSEARPVIEGQTRYMQVFGQVFFTDTGDTVHPEHFVCVLIDETERRDMLNALSRSKRLEAIGRLVGVIAHDFNNILSVILANLELATLRVSEPAILDLLLRATDAAVTGGGFNKRLLALAGGNDHAQTVLALDAHILKTWAMLEHLLSDTVSLHFQPGVDNGSVRIDPAELDGAVLNLVINARDAQPSGGNITISTHVAVVDAATAALHTGCQPGTYLRLDVTDNGPGMTADEIAHAFEPFFTTKEGGLGTGLGLTSVETAAARAGGFVTIRSEPGLGTTVSLLLPMAESPAQQHDLKKEDIPFGDGELVLVVEDDAMVREATLQRLEALGYAVIEASDAATALRLLAEGEPVDLVFTDIVLPGELSGYHLLSEISRLYPEIAVLLTSGHVSELRIPKPALDTLPDLLKKPYSLTILAQSVAQAIRPSEMSVRPQQ